MYDHIIIGAGSAGCVLANRLTADGQRTVLLLEAGGDGRDEPYIPIPRAWRRLFRTAVDWAYKTAAQPGINGRQQYWPRGKTLGGSSATNAMIYIRGQREDYDEWAKLGCDGWDYESLLPLFKQMAHQERGADAFHGTGGELNVADLSSPNPLAKAFVQAGQELGYPANPDFNGASQEGFGLLQVTQKNGRRHSAADAFLHPIAHRPNLTIATGAQATRILFEGHTAVGVEFAQDGRLHTARARGEIWLCGGAINTPQLLLLSGVGPAAELAKWGIPQVVELAGVGQNLQDHPVVYVPFAIPAPSSIAEWETAANLATWQAHGTGVASSNISEATAFVRTAAHVAAPICNTTFARWWSRTRLRHMAFRWGRPCCGPPAEALCPWPAPTRWPRRSSSPIIWRKRRIWRCWWRGFCWRGGWRARPLLRHTSRPNWSRARPSRRMMRRPSANLSASGWGRCTTLWGRARWGERGMRRPW